MISRKQPTKLIGVRIPETLYADIQAHLETKHYGYPRWSMQRIVTEAIERYLRAPSDSEILVACDRCGRRNFTKKGFAGHRCKGVLNG